MTHQSRHTRMRTTQDGPQNGSKVLHRLQRRQIARLGINAYVKPEALAAEQQKVGRNDPCPCGAGKKTKKCHPERAE